MADKKYTININLTDGRTEKLPFTAPQGPAGEGLNQDEKNFIESMMLSTSADKEGNVEIGKNLEVDGNLQVNSQTDINGVTHCYNAVYVVDWSYLYGADEQTLVDKLNEYSTHKYKHTIRFYGTLKDGEMMFFLTCYLSTNVPIASVQDLITYLGGELYQTSGNVSYGRSSVQNIISLSVGSTISKCILTVGELNYFGDYSLDQVDSLTITDNISIPR